MRRCLRAGLTGLLCALWAALALAHPMPESQLWIDTTPTGLRATLRMPLAALEIGFGQPLAANPEAALQRHGDELSRYLLGHVGARSANQGWQVLAPRLKVTGESPTAELEATLDLQAPAGTDGRSLTLLFDAITHELRNHRVMVFLRNDWAGGRAGLAPELLGEFRSFSNTLAVSLPEQGVGSSFVRLLQAGAQHIAEGTDHLLFLFMLLIVAPLRVRHGRWRSVRPLGSAARRLSVVVTAFTIGHSVTLALGSSGVLLLPSQPTEVAVAATIAFAAVHALRPLFAGGEIAMALGFGLIHGLAFSASLSGAGLTPWQHAQALLAFNLGIEAVQLAVLLAVMPPLLVLSRTSPWLYTGLRLLAALAALALAATWVVERAGFASIGPFSWIDDAGPGLALIPVLLWLAAGASYGKRRLRAAAAAAAAAPGRA